MSQALERAGAVRSRNPTGTAFWCVEAALYACCRVFENIRVSRLDVVLAQFDGLVVLLAAAHGEVFELIRANELTWFPHTQNPQAAETAETYQTAVCNGAFLLGYSYLEAFLADIVRQVYVRRPGMLPPDKTVTYKDVVGAGSSEALVLRLAEREVRSVFAGSIEDVQQHYQRRLGVRWPDEPKIVVASRIRNCLMHNDARVDERLAAAAPDGFGIGQRIALRPSEVHDYGIAARVFAMALWADVVSRHLAEPEASVDAV